MHKAEDVVPTRLPSILSRYRLPEPPMDEALVKSIRASLQLLELGPDYITFPVYAAIWRAALGPADYGVHISGETNVGKTEYAALGQQHFGPEMDSRNLPGLWSSTANALEATAFYVKDALLCVDDFVPQGLSKRR